MDPISITGVIIAGSAFLVSLYAIFSERKHKRLSCRPHLSSDLKTETSDEKWLVFSFAIHNSGLGPAIVKGFQVLLDGEPVKAIRENAVEFAVNEVFAGKNFIVENSGSLADDYALSVDREFELLKLNVRDRALSKEGVKEMMSRVDLVIEYASMYQGKEQFTYSSVEERKSQNRK